MRLRVLILALVLAALLLALAGLALDGARRLTRRAPSTTSLRVMERS
jgi:hypothetical protein